MNRLLCRCETPTLELNRAGHAVVCASCERAARLELGTDRTPEERVTYRARINTLLERAASIERQLADGRKEDKRDARRRRAATIVRLWRAGFTYAQIAEIEDCSETTVKYWASARYRQQKREAALRWKRENPEKSRDAQTRTNQRRRDQQRAYSRAWTRENPSRKRVNNLRHSAKSRAAEGSA